MKNNKRSNVRKTTEQFIEEARQVHGDKYDYSKVEYVNSATKVCIICPEHGEFRQTPDQHLNRKRGCPICGKKKCNQNRIFWTKDTIINKAKEFSSQVEFTVSCSGAYAKALKLGIIPELQKFWAKDTKPRGYWMSKETRKKAKEEGNCQTRSDYMRKFPTAYSHALKEGDINELFPINEKDIKAKIHCVYVYVFKETNSVYVGRTLERRIDKRDYEHRNYKKDTILKYSNSNGIVIPNMHVLEYNLTAYESLEREDEYVTLYKEQGYNILNKAKTGKRSGSLGALNFGKLSREFCYSVAKTCTKKSELEKKNPSVYLKSNAEGWSKDYTWFEECHKPKGYWDIEENCRQEFLKWGASITNLQKNNNVCYNHALKNGYTKKWHKKRVAWNKKWTEEKLYDLKQKYPTKILLMENEPGAYQAYLKNGILNKFYGVYKPKYSLDKVKNKILEKIKNTDFILLDFKYDGMPNIEITLKCKKCGEIKIYNSADFFKKNVNIICRKCLYNIRKTDVFGKLENYKYIKDFRINFPNDYAWLYNNGLINEARNFFEKPQKHTFEEIESIGKLFSKRSEWERESQFSYEYARKYTKTINGKIYTWLDLIMPNITDRRKAVICTNILNNETTFYESVHAVKRDGFDVCTVSMVCRHKRKSHKGHTFRFATEEEIKYYTNSN